MIVTRLCGGLGNQFFQYAAGRALALRCHTDLALDTEWFERTIPGMEPRTYELHRYPIRARLLRDPEREKIRSRLAAGRKRFSFPPRWTQFTEPDFNCYHPAVLGLRGHVYLDGFWQYPDYFQDAAPQIRAELVPSAAVCDPDPAIVRRIKEVNSVSIHVRRGDYLTSGQFIGALPAAYYSAALAWISSRVENPHFFVFSDDPNWVRENFPIAARVDYMAHEGPDAAFKDLHLMSECRHHVIANSSFSWWAAWLSSSESPLVVAPARWFAQLPPSTHSRLAQGWTAF